MVYDVYGEEEAGKMKDVLMSGHEVHPLTGTSEIQPRRVPHVDAEKRVFCGFQHQAQRRQYRVVMAPGDAPRMRPARMLSWSVNPKSMPLTPPRRSQWSNFPRVHTIGCVREESWAGCVWSVVSLMFVI